MFIVFPTHTMNLNFDLLLITLCIANILSTFKHILLEVRLRRQGWIFSSMVIVLSKLKLLLIEHAPVVLVLCGQSTAAEQ